MASGVLFDVDGTLVDSNYIHTLCWHDALRSEGHVVPMSMLHRAIGMGSSELLDHVLGAGRDREADDAIIAAHSVLYRRHWERLTTLPGAVELLRACSQRGRTVVLASSAADDELKALRDTLDADEAIDAATSSSDVESAKPASDLVEVALARGGLRADHAVFVGDSVWDAAACAEAGVSFIGLECGGTSAAELRGAGAVEVWRDPADLLGHLAESRLGG
ncbi:HAD family hydrolase [Jatrophihabitans sp.]|uniref:HAD family hydrolase n=1 Tax=Jatrophihabitans sp. TaxID=1932789 RepID=UPI0030C72930|nr:HAD-superfamily hydrolase, subfamily variant 3 [Jatrophihabitans sp.]